MALTKITQGVIKSNENYNTHNINSTGIITATGVTVNGDLNVSGVLTYDDVTNVDSIGVVTARSGVHVTGGSVGIGTDNPSAKLEIVDSYTNRTWTPTSQTELLVERNGNCIISAIGSTISNCIFNFGDSDDENVGAIDYDHADDSMEFRVNGSSKLSISSTGRITQTYNNEDIDMDAYASGQLRLDGNGYNVGFALNDQGLNIYTNSANREIIFGTNETERVRITNVGRVGINTTTPDDTFEVYDGGILAPSRRTISSVVRYGTGIQYRDTSGNQRPILHIQAYSRGLGSGSIGSNSVYVNGVEVRSTGRSWGLTVISGGGSNLGQVLHSQTYDAYGDTNAATSIINDMATYDTNNNILIVNTYDEPDQNGNGIRVALRDNYYAKHAESATRRYAYVHAWRNGYGQLGECHSATRSGSTFTNQGDNSKANAGISFTVIL